MIRQFLPSRAAGKTVRGLAGEIAIRSEPIPRNALEICRKRILECRIDRVGYFYGKGTVRSLNDFMDDQVPAPIPGVVVLASGFRRIPPEQIVVFRGIPSE